MVNETECQPFFGANSMLDPRLLLVSLLWLVPIQPSSAGTSPNLLQEKNNSLQNEVRIWTDNTGNFSVSATLDSISNQGVKLILADNRPVVVPWRRLSEQDRKYLGSWIESRISGHSILSSSETPPAPTKNNELSEQPMVPNLPVTQGVEPAGQNEKSTERDSLLDAPPTDPSVIPDQPAITPRKNEAETQKRTDEASPPEKATVQDVLTEPAVSAPTAPANRAPPAEDETPATLTIETQPDNNSHEVSSAEKEPKISRAGSESTDSHEKQKPLTGAEPGAESVAEANSEMPTEKSLDFSSELAEPVRAEIETAGDAGKGESVTATTTPELSSSIGNIPTEPRTSIAMAMQPLELEGKEPDRVPARDNAAAGEEPVDLTSSDKPNPVQLQQNQSPDRIAPSLRSELNHLLDQIDRSSDTIMTRELLQRVSLIPIPNNDQRAMQTLVRLLDNQDKYFRETAFRKIIEISPTVPVSVLQKCLRDESQAVRWKAYEIIEQSGRDDLIDELIDNLSRDRTKVLSLLTKYGDRGESVLLPMLTRVNSSLRQDIAVSLSAIGTQKSIDVIMDILKESNLSGIERLQFNATCEAIRKRLDGK